LAGGLQFFFITKPDLDFDFVGVAKIANLPDIKDKIKEELLKDLMAQAVYPGRITVPLSFTADPMLIWQPQVAVCLERVTFSTAFVHRLFSKHHRLRYPSLCNSNCWYSLYSSKCIQSDIFCIFQEYWLSD
jgi:hypothetical protein